MRIAWKTNLALDNSSLGRLRDFLISIAFLEQVASRNIRPREDFRLTSVPYSDVHIKHC